MNIFKYYVVIVLIFSCSYSFSQNYKVNYVLNARIDTTDVEVKAVLNTWIGYLQSTPDSTYDNPFWNKEEKVKYKSFDFTQGSIYQFSSDKLLQYFKLTILSITKVDSNYAIRTLFYKEGLNGEYARSNPWCITNVYAIKENKDWKLKNALDFEIKNWEKQNIGKITYVFPPTYNFKEDIANKANNFCDSIANLFEKQWQPFTFYITSSSDELGKLMGFDFFFAGVTTGIAFYDERMLFSGFGSEWYPHEFVHLVLGTPDNKFVSEGIATWLGGSMNKTYMENVKILSEQVVKNDTISFWDVFDNKWGWQYNAYYTTGAVICAIVYEKKGVKGVKKYFEEAPKKKEDFIKFLSEILVVKENEFDAIWKEYLKKAKE